jgi:catechol 2,3-dioxygenase-like lactoylglutathione lyase family enzyme
MLADRPIHATLPATDLERAKRFYTEKLGLSPESEAPGGIFFRCGEGTRFLIFPSGGTASGSHTQMGWTVEDIEAEVADMKARGVVFEQYDTPYLKTVGSVATTGPIKAAWFKDSEGNLLGLVQFAE